MVPSVKERYPAIRMLHHWHNQRPRLATGPAASNLSRPIVGTVSPPGAVWGHVYKRGGLRAWPAQQHRRHKAIEQFEQRGGRSEEEEWLHQCCHPPPWPLTAPPRLRPAWWPHSPASSPPPPSPSPAKLPTSPPSPAMVAESGACRYGNRQFTICSHLIAKAGLLQSMTV